MAAFPLTSLLLVALSLSLVLAHSQQLLVLIPNANQDLMNKFAASPRDTRGLFGNHLFLVESSPQGYSSLLADHPSALAVALPADQPISIIEGDSSSLQWASMVSEILLVPNYRILFQANGLLVVADSAPLPKEFFQVISLPFDAEYITLPESPIVSTVITPDHPISTLRKNLKRRASVSDLVNAINEDDLEYFALFLSGEHPDSDFITRQSQSTDAVRAGEWAASVFRSYGFNVTSYKFPGTYCPNIIAEKEGTRTPNSVVIVGAHLDDRNTLLNDNTGRAPGANDDGSGSAAILQIAKAINDVGASFEHTLRLALWCGEEQGLVGSRAYAKEAASNREDIVGMFQADMIGYQAYANPQCAFVNRYTNNELTAFAKEVGALYVPEITQVETSACCSDHQSFYENGYPSVGLVEGGGYTIDPKYHNVGDTVNRSGYSIVQMRGITRTLVAASAELAGAI